MKDAYPWDEALRDGILVMDHRCGERRRVRLTVLLRRNGWSGCIVGRLMDLSVTGAFIEVPPQAFPLHTVVRLEAALPFDLAPRLTHCRAMVVRTDPGGIGIVFDEMRPSAFTPLFAANSAAVRHTLAG